MSTVKLVSRSNAPLLPSLNSTRNLPCTKALTVFSQNLGLSLLATVDLLVLACRVTANQASWLPAPESQRSWYGGTANTLSEDEMMCNNGASA